MSASTHLRAIGYALAGFTIWVGADTFMKLAGEASLPPFQVIGFLGFFSAFFMVLKAAPKRQVKALWPRQPRHQIARALLSLGSNFFNVIALKHLPMTLFYITVFTAPLMIALLASLFLKEKLSWQKIAAIIVGFSGVVIAIDPFQSSGSTGDWIGYAAGTASTICYASSTVWLRVMTQSESVDSVAFFTGFVEFVIGTLCMLFYAEPITLKLFMMLMGMSFFCVIGNVLNFTALRMTSAANVAQFHYTQIIAGSLIGFLIWHDVPTWNTVAGAGIIIAAGLYIAAHAHRTGRTQAVA